MMVRLRIYRCHSAVERPLSSVYPTSTWTQMTKLKHKKAAEGQRNNKAEPKITRRRTIRVDRDGDGEENENKI